MLELIALESIATSSLTPHDVGVKAFNLGLLIGRGVNVPRGFILCPEVVESIFINDNYAFHIAQQLLEILRPPLIARSSANFEDSVFFSFAGQYETFKNLHTVDSLVKALRACRESVSAKRVTAYCKLRKVPSQRIRLAILVQEMASLLLSGVLYTQDPITHRENLLILEFTDTKGDLVVSGEIKPKYFEVNKKDLNIVSGSELPTSEWSFLKKICSVAIAEEERRKMPLDIEWGLDERDYYIFQVRPVATNVYSTHHIKSIPQKVDILATGVIASRGISKGNAYWIDKKVPNHLPADSILFADSLDINLMTVFPNIRGIATRNGGRLSHPANLARELSIPYLVQTSPFSREALAGEVVLDCENASIYRNL